ncbi:MAG: translation initiation factor IF-2 N-terminal domain-containing protein, partial [Rhodococcus sp.]|nr:translation initiation factor IF-2 N-terminal domain-containing protein [Rhodococcus sp. (in: high G+C Gram-positive bacteria)]
VREVAKQCGVSNKTALKALKEIGSDVKSVNAAIDRSTAFKLYGLLAQPR